MATTTANEIADQNQTAPRMVSVSFNAQYKKLYLQHPTTALLTNRTSEGEFKTRYNNHTKSFRHRECMNETELLKDVWNLKDHGLDDNLS